MRQFARYLACSGCAAGINFAAGFALVQIAGFTSALGYPLAVALGYGLGMAANFALNRRFTFAGSPRSRLEQGRTFLVVALSGLGLTTALAASARAALSALLGPAPAAGGLWGPLTSPETMGQAAAIGAVSVYSFAAHRYLTFNRGIRFQFVRAARRF